MTIIIVLLTAVLFLLFVAVIYRKMPFEPLEENKPSICYFPKYAVEYHQTYDQLASTLLALGFGKNGSNKFSRGKHWGDFSARHIRLDIDIDEQAKLIYVYSPVVGILFDTGDLWQLTNDILNPEGVVD